MKDPLEIFKSKHYHPFDFKLSLLKISQEIFKDSNFVFIKDNYFVINKNQLGTSMMCGYARNKYLEFEKKDVKIYKNKMLEKKELYVCKIEQISFIKKIKFKEDIFLIKLLQEEIFWINSFLNNLFEHLSYRESENQKLINHGMIKINLAKIITLLETIQISLNNKKMQIAVDDIRRCCQGLARLAGGRAFLAHSIIEMLWIFEMINKIYIS